MTMTETTKKWLIPLIPSCYPVLGQRLKERRHGGFSHIAAGVRAPVPGRGRLRRMVARAPLGTGLRLPGVRARRVLAARAQGPDLAVQGLPAGELRDRGDGDAPQPPAPEGLVYRPLGR